MTDNAAAKPAKRKFSWNPLVPIEDEAHARLLAKESGVACLGLIAFGYVALSFVVMIAGESPYAPGGDKTVTLIAHAVALAIAAGLGWQIWKKQPVWAVIITLVWICLETAAKVMMVIGGGSGAASFVLNALGLVVGVQAVRGALWLSKQKKS
ncbi:hypothetical protein [Brevundimonas sp.]|jgi:hypothetical protein|uniref:hypothetical protein n=1 Tax=Brevundimonas sp. TaxID=1871086 RepID=UPI002FCC9754